MDLTKINFHHHPQWELIESSPHRLIFKSPYINDEYAAVEIETEGETLDKGETFGTIEAVKTVSDLFMPVDAKVLEFNKKLDTNPELVNQDPYGDGWMVKIELSDLSQIDGLLSAADYAASVGA